MQSRYFSSNHLWHLTKHAQTGYTALIYAAIEGRAECVRLLLDAGADKEAADEVRASRSAVCASGRACVCLAVR